MVEKLLWDAPDTTENLIGKLQSENVALCSTDTVLGLLAPVSQAGFIQLNEIKGRFEKPYILLIENAVLAKQFAKIPALEGLNSLMNACWPGPLTIIFKAKDDLPSYVQSVQGTVALRVPNHGGLLRLLAFFPALFSTSANKAGKSVPPTENAIDPEIMDMVSCVVTDRKHNDESRPSTILDVTGQRPRVIREGAYSIHELEKIYGQVFE